MKTYCLLQRTEDNDHLWRAVQEGPGGTFSVDLLQHVCLPQLPAPTHFDCLKNGPEKWPRLVVKREEKKLGTQVTKRFERICSYFLHVCSQHLNLQFITQLFCLIYWFHISRFACTLGKSFLNLFITVLRAYKSQAYGYKWIHHHPKRKKIVVSRRNK